MSTVIEAVDSADGFSVIDRYERLDLLDRHAAQTLNEYCRVKSSVGVAAARLANVSALHSFVASVPLAIADCLALLASLLLTGTFIHYLLFASVPPLEADTALFISLIVLPISHLAGLYPGLGLNQAIEFRQIAKSLFACLLVFSILGWLFLDEAAWYYGLVAVLTFAFALPAVVTARFVARQVAGMIPYWGVPTFIVATPERGVELYRRLKAKPELGFRPVGILLDPNQYWNSTNRVMHLDGVPLYDIRHTDEEATKLNATWVFVSECAKRGAAPTLDPSLAAVPNRVLLSSNQLDFACGIVHVPSVQPTVFGWVAGTQAVSP